MKLALCCIGKAKVFALDEWVKHHTEAGFDHIYIYEGGTAPNILDEIDESRRDKVTVVSLPYVDTEYDTMAYADCFRNHRSEYNWIAFFDADQYIVLPEKSSVKEILSDERFLDYEAVRINVEDFSDGRSLAMDMNLPVPDENGESGVHVARTIVNCQTTGVYFTPFTIQRNGTPVTQCLPNLQKLEPSDAEVPCVDFSTMYLTPNTMETMWIKWKKERGFW